MNSRNLAINGMALSIIKDIQYSNIYGEPIDISNMFEMIVGAYFYGMSKNDSLFVTKTLPNHIFSNNSKRNHDV